VDAAPGTPPEPPAGVTPPSAPADHSCAKCGAAMVPGQDWCLQCGAGAPTSPGSSGWRSAATLLGITIVLALGAVAAAYAALSKETPKPPTVTATVAQATIPPASTTPVTPSTTLPTTPNVKTTLPQVVKPPKIPLTAIPTPKNTETTKANTPGAQTTPAKTTPTITTPANTGGAGGEEPNQASIMLDTNAASTYNPYNYPESDFGDPSLTIDGDTTTGWTAIVEPATAPKMAEGVLIDLKTPHKLAYVKVITPTIGITVQLYGSAAKTAPTSITDPAWVPISHLQVLSKKHAHIKLRDQKKSFTNVVLWISKAPTSAVGTPEAPGHVGINELELFPAQ
jgi:hypothetical protein